MKCLSQTCIVLIHHKIYLILWCSVVMGVTVGNWTLQRRWVSANFGSTLAASPVFSDFNRDGHLDAVVLSFDGELIVMDVTGHGKSLPNTDWPAYHYGHHFFSAPILFDVDRDGVDEIVIISFSGSIFIYDWKGVLLSSSELTRFHLPKNLLTSSESKLLSILNSNPRNTTKASVELRPEVYSSPVLVDLNSDDRSEELVFATNYGVVQKQKVEKEYNYLFEVKVVFNLTSMSTLSHIFLECKKRQSEFPAYFLSNAVAFVPPGKEVHIAATSASGKVFVWRGQSLDDVSGFPYEYGSSIQSPTIVWPNYRAVIVTSDFWGNVLGLDLNGQQVWETTVKGSPSAARRWFLGRNETVILGTNSGHIYALNATNGHPLPNYPTFHPGMKFSAPPLLMSRRDGKELAGFLAQEADRMTVIDINNPKDFFQTNFFGEMSHLGPSLLPHKLADGCSLFLPFSDGAVGCYTAQVQFVAGSSSAFKAVELFPYQSLSIYVGADLFYGGTGSTLFVYGETVTVILYISDRSPTHAYDARVSLGGRRVHTEELVRAGYHHLIFKLISEESEGLLVVEVRSLLNGEAARDHLWLHRPNFLQRNQSIIKTFLAFFVIIFILLICLHVYRRRDVVIESLDVVIRSYRRCRRTLRPHQESFLPLCYRPTTSTVSWRRPFTASFYVTRKLCAAVRDLISRMFARRKSRYY